MKNWPVLAQLVGGIMVSGGFGVMLGWAIGCTIFGAGMIAVGTLAERAKMIGKG